MTTTTTPSPLDASLRRLLAVIRNMSDGFTLGTQTADIARTLDMPEAFIEALFVSARTRGLLKPTYAGRGRVRWTVSATGDRFLEQGEHHTTESSARS